MGSGEYLRYSYTIASLSIDWDEKKKKSCQTGIPYSVKIFFKNVFKMKILLKKIKINRCQSHVLKEMVKEVL